MAIEDIAPGFGRIDTAPGRADNQETKTSDADRAKVRQLAEQFESMLLTQMLREMKDSMAPDTDSGGLGGEIMGDTVNSELGQSLGKAGGVGMADALMKALTRLDQSDKAAATGDMTMGMDPQVTDLSSGLEKVNDVASGVNVASGFSRKSVSSDFGWRNDPINGQQKFHAGMDLRLAYGQEVRAAAGGVVKSAGDHGGYGLSVVIDHGDGIETRYAHLSTADVRVGEVVGAGQPIAHSGNSGRSTGAHLHFEVRKDGQPVDPEAVSGLVQIADMPGRTGH